MERKTLQPEQIIVPGEYELGNESILKIYFRVFDMGHGADLPPAIVVGARNLEGIRKKLERFCRSWEKKKPKSVEHRRKDYEQLFGILQKQPYFLIDGNHKTAAATLTHSPINALEIQTNEDLGEIERMVEDGEIFDFKRPERDISALKEGFIAFCLQLYEKDIENSALPIAEYPILRYTKTIKERVDELASGEDLPRYMRERYLRKGN